MASRSAARSSTICRLRSRGVPRGRHGADGESVGDPQFNRQQDQTNASRISSGGRRAANNYLVDGVPITELTGRAVLNPSIEAIDEVKVQVHTYDADMGRTGGGVFNTQPGRANQFHGTGFYQTRPVWGQSENYFNAVAGLTKEETGLANARFHTYRGGIGGPIWRNRTFFWTATEGYPLDDDAEPAGNLAEHQSA